MSDDLQTTSNSLSDHFLNRAERVLFNFLNDGPREYSAIWKHLKKQKISQSTLNRMLNDNTQDNRLLRIEKGANVFYRINDFPLNVKVLLVLLDNLINEEKNRFEALRLYHFIFQTPLDNQALFAYQTFKRNITRMYPKIDLRKIYQLTIAEMNASASGNQSVINFLERLKSALD